MRFAIDPALEREARIAKRATPSVVRRRPITVGSITYTAFEADSLLAMTSEASLARPGHPGA